MTPAVVRRPLLVYDGDCGFCERCATFVRRRSTDVGVEPYQALDLAEHGVTAEDAAAAALWIPATGAVKVGHDAITAALAACRRPWSWLGRLLSIWPLSMVGRRLYPVIARNRHRLPGSTAACKLPPD